MRADDLNSLNSGASELKTLSNVSLNNKDRLVITLIMYCYKAYGVLKGNS